MSDHGIAYVGRVSLEAPGGAGQALQPQAIHLAQTRPQPGGASAAGGAEASASGVRRGESESGTQKPVFKMAEVSLRFMIDAETKDVTILILDRASRKVVRTIPPEEMAELDPGELLQLFV